MKMMIMTDMEGVAGILNHDDWVLPAGRCYRQGLRLLTEEVNAVVDGFWAGGAREIVVFDGHGVGGIDPMLDERAQLVAGALGLGWPWVLDASYAGLAFVGQHAKAHSIFAYHAHTGFPLPGPVNQWHFHRGVWADSIMRNGTGCADNPGRG